MPKITAWKCPHTAKLFEDEKKYRTHLSRLSRQRCAARKWDEKLKEITDVITGIQQVKNMQEWCEYLVEHQDEFILYGMLNDYSSSAASIESMKNGATITFPKIKSIAIYNSHFSKTVSNSHSCPRDGVTNWAGMEDHGIIGYPGWSGRISLEYECKDKSIGGVLTVNDPNKLRSNKYSAPSISRICSGFSSVRSLSGVNTGTGGGGNGGSFDVRIFMQDFPNIEEPVNAALKQIEKDKTWQILNKGLYREDLSPLNKIGEGRVEK